MKAMCILLMSMVLVAHGCGSKNDDSKNRENDTFIKDIMTQDNKEAYVLLSLKYNIEEEAVSKMIKEYTNSHDWTKRFMESNGKNFKINLNNRKTIDDLSLKYSIKPETIAALLIDYKSIYGKEVDNFHSVNEPEEMPGDRY